MVEAYRRDATSKDQLISELKATKKRLDSEVKVAAGVDETSREKRSMEVEHSRLQKEMSQVQQQVVDLEGHLHSAQRERGGWKRSYRFGGMSDV